MTPQRETIEIYSEFGGDAVMGELVQMFVDELPERVEMIESALSSGDMESLQRIAHQMKGAVGSYGFDQLTSYAAAVESSVGEPDGREQIHNTVQELIQVCGYVRSGERG
jgi:HPt (histidine-containing phosphotransfer) domain-containing protein